MNAEYLHTQEVGSLAKPDWRTRIGTGMHIESRDVESAVRWGKRLRIDADPLIQILATASSTDQPLSPEEKKEIRRWSSLYAIRLQEQAGLDVIYDGEQNRIEMYEHAVRRSHGFESRGLVRSWDNKYSAKFACVGEPSVAAPWHVDELLAIQKLTHTPIKVPITGAYTLAAWSFNEHYDSRKAYILDIAKNLLRPNIEALIAAGAQWIQIDEPAATTIPQEVPLFVEAFNESIRGLNCQFSVHICFSDYNLLFPHITNMEHCSQYSLEFANRDSQHLGTKPNDRPAYEILKLFKDVPGGIGLGVVDVHSNVIESPELVRDRVLYAADMLGDPSRVQPSPDCGLRTRTWDVAFEKLSNVVAGTRLAEKILTG